MNKKIILILSFFTIAFNSISQSPGGPGSGVPCPPFSPCWCSQHPGNPHCPPTAVPITDHIYILIAAGIFLVFYTYKRQHKIEKR